MTKNIFRAGVLSVLALLCAGIQDAGAQKRPVDIDACMQWKRVDSPDISPTGRWVTYRVSKMEYDPEYKDGKNLHLVDTQTGYEQIIEDRYSVSFYDNDRGLYYHKTDTTGKEITVLI